MPNTIRIGTRGSALALWQTHHVAHLLRAAHPGLVIEEILVTTRGDRVLDTPLPLLGGKGAFTAELEQALHDGKIDCAVHSLKDLPTEDVPNLVIAAIPTRADPRDSLVCRTGRTLDELPPDARIGTSSPRRAALLRARGYLNIHDIRGNVDTRLRKAAAPDGGYDAIILASAGLDRLGLASHITQRLPAEVFIPAPGQGALAVQCHAASPARQLLAALDDADTRAAVTAERAFLSAVGGGCAVPLGAYAHHISDGMLQLHAVLCSPDGRRQWRGTQTAPVAQAHTLGTTLAAVALNEGAPDLLGG